jgi:hypothetical protein
MESIDKLTLTDAIINMYKRIKDEEKKEDWGKSIEFTNALGHMVKAELDKSPFI